MNRIFIEATTISDAWAQLVFKIIDEGKVFKIDSGSYAGQKRLEFDWVDVLIKYPGVRPLTPQIPEGLGIPNPVSEEYATTEYPLYLMTSDKKKGEQYTYGERLTGWVHEEIINQVEEVIKKYKKDAPGYRTNQCSMSVSTPSDILLSDPPCLREIDTRIQDGKLHFFVYFRSWDLWGGFPANLAGIQILKEYMAGEIGVEDGELIATSKGLHIYDHCFDVAKIRSYKQDYELKNGE